MNDLKESVTTEYSEDRYVAGEPVDYSVEHSDEYYEQFIAAFEPNRRPRRAYRFFKRAFDILASASALTLLAPVMLAIVIAIRIDSKGCAIFKQERMGRHGKVFLCYKFRSMTVEAPRDCASSLLENPDLYVTRVGRFLRKTSLDELPQLFCVLVGSMSLIGYRPLVLTEKKCNAMRDRLGVFEVRPGISGYAQVHGRDQIYYKNKAILDAEYVKNASLLLDLKLLFKTVAVVLRKDGNHDKNR